MPPRISPFEFRRTPAEKQDIQLSWKRPDLAFFSAGACHILAFAFIEQYPKAGFTIKFIRPVQGFSGMHLYVSDGVQAFDAQGYFTEAELWREYRDAHIKAFPGWEAEIIDIQVPLTEFCKANQHRPPKDFPCDVWARAQAYLATFPSPEL